MLACMQGGLWKKQLIASFVKHFIKSHKNTICIGFQVYNPKLSQEECISAIKGYVRALYERRTW